MNLEKMIIDIIKRVSRRAEAVDTTAQVLRVEGDTAWVHLDGGVAETPVSMGIDCKPGDSVRVRVVNGDAYIVGNPSAPPTDDTQANVAVRQSNRSLEMSNAAVLNAQAAQESANAAASAADQAISDAAAAATAAGNAQSSANAAANAAAVADGKAVEAGNAASAAQSSANAAASAAATADSKAVAAGNAASAAQTAANNAQASANHAGAYASRALGNLETVQSVVETLNWITAHGTMTLTTDTSLDPTHVYFVVDPNGDYTVGTTKYSVVSDPQTSELSTYYELSIDESLNNYIATHLVVDGEGLWIIPESNGFKVLIATGSGSTHTTAGTYIVDGNGETIGEFTTNAITLGSRETGTTVGTGSRVFGVQCEASGAYSYAEGYKTRATGDYSHAEGRKARFINPPNEVLASGVGAHAEGENTEALGRGSHAEGRQGTASGECSHVEGYMCTASGTFTHAEGSNTVAGPNQYAHAEGDSTQASARSSHAEGDNTTATGQAAHAEGWGADATHSAAHAEGIGTLASGYASHAGGYHTIASNRYQTAVGKYNDNKEDTLFEVGNGTADDARSNAFEVTSDGSVRTGKTGYKVAFGAKEQNIAAGSWTASSYTSPSGTVYAYKYAVPINGLTGASFVDITITSGSYIGVYCVESDSTTGYAVIRTATLPSAALGFRIYYTLV